MALNYVPFLLPNRARLWQVLQALLPETTCPNGVQYGNAPLEWSRALSHRGGWQPYSYTMLATE